jgi:hypothetical protein
VRASINAQSARLSLTGSADQLYILRGLGATLARNRQQTFSGSLSGRLWRDFTISGTVGGFSTTYLSEVGSGFDRSLFWGVGTQVTLRGSLRALAWVRSEDTTAASTHFDQKSLSGLARLEYRLRAVNVGFEYRHNDNLLHYGERCRPACSVATSSALPSPGNSASSCNHVPGPASHPRGGHPAFPFLCRQRPPARDQRGPRRPPRRASVSCAASTRRPCAASPPSSRGC